MRILLLLVLCFWGICAHTQLRLGIQYGYSRAGWASVNPAPGDFDDSYTTAGLSGFQSGIITEIKLTDKLLLRPALFVSGKGTTLKHQSWYDTSSRGIWIRYVEVPVMLAYHGSLSSKVAGFAGGGFYAAYGFRGVEKGESKSLSGDNSIYNKVEFGTRNDGPGFQTLPTIVKPFDYGFTVLAGVELEGVQLLLTYSRGLKTLLPNGKPYSSNYSNSGLTISAAYLISTKRLRQWFR